MPMIYIRDKLRRVGKSQAQLAGELGVSRVIVSEWACGRKVPSTRRMPELAAALKCKVDDLYVDTGENESEANESA